MLITSNNEYDSFIHYPIENKISDRKEEETTDKSFCEFWVPASVSAFSQILNLIIHRNSLH